MMNSLQGGSIKILRFRKMYEEVRLLKSPKIARLLLSFVDAGALVASDTLYELAIEGVFTESDLKGFPGDIDKIDLNLLQFVDDRNGRCIVLEGERKAFLTLLARVWLRNLFPLLIITRNPMRDYELINRIFPDKKISDNFLGLLESDCDIHITTIVNVYNGEMMRRTRFQTAIYNELVSPTKHYSLSKFSDTAREIFGFTGILNLHSFMLKDEKRKSLSDSELLDQVDISNSGSLMWRVWEQLGFISEGQFSGKATLKANNSYSKAILGEHDRVVKHMQANGYNMADRKKLLPMINICTELVK